MLILTPSARWISGTHGESRIWHVLTWRAKGAARGGTQGLQRQVTDLTARHKAAKDAQAKAEGHAETLSAASKDLQVPFVTPDQQQPAGS